MKHPLVAASATAAVLLCVLSGAAAPTRTASVIAIWRIPAPLSADSSVQSVEAGVIALNFIGPQLDALARHPGAKITLALDPIFVAALERAAAGDSALAGTASGQIGANDLRATQLLDVLSSDVVPVSNVARSAVGRRFTSDAAAARLALMGDRAAHFSQRDDVDFAAAAILISLASSGRAAGKTELLNKTELSNQDLQSLAEAFGHACRDVLDKLKRAAGQGTIELAAVPAYEPIMPLVINAGGRTRQAPFTVNLNAGADVGSAVDQGLHAVRSLSPSRGDPGVLAPSGAYNDETGVLLQAHHAAYGVFSERVVKANAGASAASVADVHSAAFRPYLLETSKTSRLPLFFCSDTTSNALDSQPPSQPATGIADRLEAAVSAALASSPPDSPTVFVVCLNGTGTVLRRPDRGQVLDYLIAMITNGRSMRAAAPREYLRQHPPTAETYGYGPGSDAGGFDLWMGSANQMSLWNALADARKAAGGDGALLKAEVREPLLRAESGLWYLSLALSQPRAFTDQSLSRFRSLIADIYRAAGKPVPPDIAPVKLDAPAPVGVEGK